MKSKVFTFGLALVMVLTFSGQMLANELKIIPMSGSGLSQSDLTGTEVTLDGVSLYNGIIDEEGLVKSITGKSLDIEPGDYILSFTVEGYKAAEFDVTIPETPEGLPELTISREISLSKLTPPTPAGGGSPPTVRSLFEDEQFWGYVMITLLLLIAVLVIVIVVVVMRRRSMYMGGAAVKKEKPKTEAAAPAPEEVVEEAEAAEDAVVEEEVQEATPEEEIPEEPTEEKSDEEPEEKK